MAGRERRPLGEDWLGNVIHEQDVVAYVTGRGTLVTAKVVDIDEYGIWVQRAIPRVNDRQRNFIALPHGSQRYILLACFHGQEVAWSL